MDGVEVWMEQKCGWSRSVDGVEVWMEQKCGMKE